MFEINTNRIKRTALEEQRIARSARRCAARTQDILRTIRADGQTTALVKDALARVDDNLFEQARRLDQYAETASVICREYENSERKAAGFVSIRIYGFTAFQRIDLRALTQTVLQFGEIRI